MSYSEKLRKHDLECLRLASDCMQLACDVPNPALQSHFVRMAKALQSQVAQGPDADTQTKHSTKKTNRADTRPSRRQPTLVLH